MTDTTDIITQEQVSALLERLQQLHQRLQTTRQELAPMESNLAHMYKEYQAAIGHLQREHYQLQTKIRKLQELLDGSDQGQDNGEDEEIIIPTDIGEIIAKDILHEHIFREHQAKMEDERE